MLNLNLSGQSQQPLYMQLYTQIRNQIRSGEIPQGVRLPSVKSLQLQTSLSKTTIESAYQLLVAEGYAVSRPRSGLYVFSPLDGVKPTQLPSPQLDQPLGAPLQTAPGPTGPLIDFKPSATDEASFPIRAWRRALQTALAESHGKLCQYGDPQGEYPLRSVLAEYLRNSRGVICRPDQIVIGSGIQYSIGILAKLFTGIQRIAFEEPGYAPVREQLSQTGFQVIPIPVTEKGLSLAELSTSDAQAVYVTPSHQFPTGGVMPYAEREYLLEWARSKEAYIIEDDYDGEFRYFGRPIPSLQGLDPSGRVIYLGTFSKAFTPALRLNYMVLPSELLDRMRRIPYLLDAPSRIDQWAMQSYIEGGDWYRHIRRMRNTYRKKHHQLIRLMQAHFGDAIAITGHNAGLHIQVTVKTNQSVEALVRLAAESGVRVHHLQEMWLGPIPPGYPQIYLGFGGVSERQIEVGVQLLKRAWEGILARVHS